MKRLILICVLGATPWLAMAAGEIELKSTVEKVVTFTDVSGQARERLETVDSVIPGDVVVYSITYTNISEAPVEDVVISNPVPNNTVYIDGSAGGENTTITFSVDGANTFAAADDLRVTQADGAERAAVAEDYTAIRWAVNGEVEPGARGIASFRAQVK